MKKIIILIIILLFSNIIIADVSATTVFLTSDNIVNSDTDRAILNSIKDYVEKLSDGKIKVEVDSQAPGPGEATRAMLANADVRIDLGACCAGSLYELAKYSVKTSNQVIYINSGDFDLDNGNYLRRAWDDNFSNKTFAGYNNPGQLLNKSGVSYIQPVKTFSNEFPEGVLNQNKDEVNKYIAEEIVKAVNNHDNSSKTIDTSLFVLHKMPVEKMAKGSEELYSGDFENENKTFNGYSGAQMLYLTSSYLNGNGLEEPGDYKPPSSPLKSSFFAKDSYSINDYMKMGGIVKNYMDEHHQAPDYINYEGAFISYYDLSYNFAKITKNHTDSKSMDFKQYYTFDKVNDSFITDLLPILVGAIVILSGYLLIRRKRMNNRRKHRKRRYKR